jgi:O-antigen ligase
VAAFRWVAAGVLLTIGLVVAATSSPAVSLVIVLAILLAVSGVLAIRHFYPKIGAPAVPWVPELLLLPIILAIRTQAQTFTLIAMIAVCALSFLRTKHSGEGGNRWPLYVLIAASVVVLSRPSDPRLVIIFALAVVFLIRISSRVSMRRAVSSLIDGAGLYCIVNVTAYSFGLRSIGETLRTGGLLASDGASRVIYPFASSLNLPPAMAALFIAAVVLLIGEQGALRRCFRIAAAVASVIVLLGAGARIPLLIAVIVPVVVVLLPRVTRTLAPLTALFSVLSAVLLPVLFMASSSAITLITDLVPALSRNANSGSDATLNGRTFIWSQSIEFWLTGNRDTGHSLLGYGVQGQYLSGASSTYASTFGTSLTNPLAATVHNSFLQQLFDGGWIGALLLGIAAIVVTARWATTSLSRTTYSMAGLSAMISLLLSSTTEVSLSPGVLQETFFMFLALAVFCTRREQVPTSAPGLIENTSAAEAAPAVDSSPRTDFSDRTA